ncbi:DNA polymerase II large subunit [Candidatus Woesearchaeota archaeon]|nr:DNA polymerase II large subunit [Candidatus Woesearchaeota archaeon]
MQASPRIKNYFESLKKGINEMHELASRARIKGHDPEKIVEVELASNMAELVVGLISVIVPQIKNKGMENRILDLEKQYGLLDWRVCLTIALEVAQEKFCTFETKKEAIETGIRMGFAYVTLGVVSSPLDGFIGLDFKKRRDNRGEYFCLNFAGPIRNAGGTGASVCVLVADYVRRKLGYDVYDADEKEIKRTMTELQDYHERVTNLQYYPSEEEIDFLMKNIPVEIGGDPSEKFEVSNYKDLPRVPTNLIRSGFCLILSSCIPLKAPKLWKQINNWGKDFDMDQWNFLEKFLQIQKKSKSKEAEKKTEEKITPDYTYIKDLVAGRPVLGDPLTAGGFRLRYGRARVSGYSGQSIHPATKYFLNSYIAVGTQLKVERPGKAASITSCDLIEGPTVKLINGDVLKVSTLKQAKEHQPNIKEILFLGDILISYGDFFNRAHSLVPAGYCEEWWAQELEQKIKESFQSIDLKKTSELTRINEEKLKTFIEQPLIDKPNVQEAITLSEKLNVPLHPEYTYHWNLLSKEQFEGFLEFIKKSNFIEEEKIVLPLTNEKILLEIIGLPHTIIQKDFIVIKKEEAAVIKRLFFNKQIIYDKSKILDFIKTISDITVRDKSGIYIGARMGRPEKAKMRKLTGSPHMLFPVGEEGGKFRSIQSCLEKERVTSQFAQFFCSTCNQIVINQVCEYCDKPTIRYYNCKICGNTTKEKCQQESHKLAVRKKININELFNLTLKKIKMTTYPDLIKGVRGTTNNDHIPESIAKGILRAKHDIYVNKDGTTRYDMTQLPITHFKPEEMNTPISKLRSLGYENDIHGKPLLRPDQIAELLPQDVILPACEQAIEQGADKILLKVANFIDNLLESLYGERPFYNIKNEEDLIGQLVVCLAPHTSVGTVGRIIGFSKTQGFFAHPLLHAATRRDCDGDEACVLLLMDAFLNFSKKFLPNTRGATMDAPLVLRSVIIPGEVDDMVFDLDIAWKYPLELYEKAQQFAMPWEVKIPMLKHKLNTPDQYENMGFTHDLTNLNHSVLCSAYKTLPTMEEKLRGQMDLAEKIRAVNTSNVARLVIEKHFLKDLKGNLRKFSNQTFRCVDCNAKFRRPPLIGRCLECNGKIIFTVSEGSITKYLEPTISLAKKYELSPYLVQTVELLQQRIEDVFGKDKEKQTGLGAWFG